MITDSEAKRKFGLTDADLEGLRREADAFDSGEWPAGRVSRVGRPASGGEPTRPVTFRLVESKASRVDEKAARLGISRGEALREAVDEWLAQA